MYHFLCGSVIGAELTVRGQAVEGAWVSGLSLSFRDNCTDPSAAWDCVLISSVYTTVAQRTVSPVSGTALLMLSGNFHERGASL